MQIYIDILPELAFFLSALRPAVEDCLDVRSREEYRHSTAANISQSWALGLVINFLPFSVRLVRSIQMFLQSYSLPLNWSPFMVVKLGGTPAEVVISHRPKSTSFYVIKDQFDLHQISATSVLNEL